VDPAVVCDVYGEVTRGDEPDPEIGREVIFYRFTFSQDIFVFLIADNVKIHLDMKRYFRYEIKNQISEDNGGIIWHSGRVLNGTTLGWFNDHQGSPWR
jgi:hypothetical protein